MLPYFAKIPYLGYTENSWAESEVNLALKFAVFFYQFVSLNDTVDVTNKLDSISIISSGYGSVP